MSVVRIFMLLVAMAPLRCTDAAPWPARQGDSSTDEGDSCTLDGVASSFGNALVIALRHQAEARLNSVLLDEYRRVLDIAGRAASIPRNIKAELGFDPSSLIVLTGDEFIRLRWGSGELATGVAALDDLLAEYGLHEVVSYQSFPGTYVLGFRELLKTSVVAEQINLLGVVNAGPSFTYDVGNHIEDVEIVSETDGGWTVEYSLGWTDCFAGYIEHHYWRVRVNAEGSLGDAIEEGPPVPADWCDVCSVDYSR